jgi:uncharacterized protein (TIGR03067 family)
MALAVALVLAVRGFGGGPGDDRAKLQGAWKVTELDENGKPKPSAAGKNLLMVFEGDVFRMKGAGEEYDGTFKLDTTKTPRRIDTVVTGVKGKGKRTQGIYELKGDTLKIVWTEGKAPRPTSFSDKFGAGVRGIVLQRAGK